MENNSNDLYAQIIKKLEEKERQENLNQSLRPKENEVDNVDGFDDNYRKVACKVKKNDIPSKKQKKKSKKNNIKKTGDRKMRKLLLVLIFLQIMLLGTMLYLLYDKIFDSNFKVDAILLKNDNYDDQIDLSDFDFDFDLDEDFDEGKIRY